jgi:hypothetical protein
MMRNLVDLNNTPPSFSVTTTAVESSSAAIAGAELFDAAPFNSEEIVSIWQSTTNPDPDIEGNSFYRGIGSKIHLFQRKTTQCRINNAYRP